MTSIIDNVPRKCQFATCTAMVLENVLSDEQYNKLLPAISSQSCDLKIDKEDLFFCCLEGHFNDHVKCRHDVKLECRVTKSADSEYYKKKYYACRKFKFPNVCTFLYVTDI